MTVNTIHWLGHASILIEGEQKIYIDPWQLGTGLPPADLILVTHSHHDHCSREDVNLVSQPQTIIFAPPDCAACLPPGFRPAIPGMKVEIGGVAIEAVPAYNIDRPFHPRSSNWVGYLVEMGGERIYHAGDSDFIPEMEEITADIALLPVGGTYTMDAAEAARAADRIAPSLAIPIHYNRIVGSAADAERFIELTGIPAKILLAESKIGKGK